jgi:hypothetical protein
MSLESFSLFFATRACVVAVWNVIMIALDATNIATLAAGCASIIVRMIVTTSGGLAVSSPMTGTLPAAGRGAPIGDPPPTWLLSPVAALGVPLPVLGGLGLVPVFLPLRGLLIGTVTAVLLACPPNTLEKLLMGGLALALGHSSSASSGEGWPVHALVPHVFIALDITIRFHWADMVLTGCFS